MSGTQDPHNELQKLAQGLTSVANRQSEIFKTVAEFVQSKLIAGELSINEGQEIAAYMLEHFSPNRGDNDIDIRIQALITTFPVLKNVV